jgi:hypothetical protein
MSKHKGYRVITWTKRDGVTGSTDELSCAEAVELKRTLEEANPPWLYVEIEPKPYTSIGDDSPHDYAGDAVGCYRCHEIKPVCCGDTEEYECADCCTIDHPPPRTLHTMVQTGSPSAD